LDKEIEKLKFIKFLLCILDKRKVEDPTICIYDKSTKEDLTLKDYIIKKCKELFDAEVKFNY
jgi:hypothetical protein